MSININENTVGIWYVSWHKEDFMLGLSRVPDTDGYEIRYRFRYYVDDDLTNNSKDRKSWYGARNTFESNEKATANVREFVKRMVDVRPGRSSEILMDERGVENFMERFSKEDFVNVMVLPMQADTSQMKH